MGAWTNGHKKKFYLLPSQVAIARVDKLDLRLSTYQRSQRQYSRFLGMVKNMYGGKNNLQQLLEKCEVCSQHIAASGSISRQYEALGKAV